MTIFNRGKREKLLPLEFPVEHLYGNRDPELPADDERGPDGALLHPDASPKGLEQLVGRDWDVVIDNPTTFPRWVRQAAEVLKGHTKQFVFVSTISVYEKNDTSNADETAPVAKTNEPNVEEMRLYGALKALATSGAGAASGSSPAPSHKR